MEQDKDYVATRGSVIIKLQNSFLKTLKVGEHTLTAMFDDGNDVDVVFRVLEASATNEDDKTAETKTYKVTFDANGHGTAPSAQTPPPLTSIHRSRKTSPYTQNGQLPVTDHAVSDLNPVRLRSFRYPSFL